MRFRKENSEFGVDEGGGKSNREALEEDIESDALEAWEGAFLEGSGETSCDF